MQRYYRIWPEILNLAGIYFDGLLKFVPLADLLCMVVGQLGLMP